MFERRLKISLGILLSVMSVLLLRAFHLQVLTRGQWVQAADDFKKKAIYVETTRGRILDNRGRELAVDEACMDACVDYRAITRDPAWIKTIALKRAAAVDGWAKADPKQHAAILVEQIEAVKRDIDAMFLLVAKETGRDPEQIEDLCRQIDMQVSMSRRYRQFKRYETAEKTTAAKGETPWYRRWLGSGGPEIDDFTQPEGEEVGLHPLAKNISSEAYLHLARALPQCPGLQLRPGTHRVYRYGSAACHVLGTVSTVQAEDLKGDANRANPLLAYRFNDTIGRGGLEAMCEPTLRGKRGRSYKSPDGGDDDVEFAPVPGADVKTTIDIELQAQIQQMFAHMTVLSNHSPEDKRTFEVPMHGAAVVIDVKSSDVLALVSYPDFDVNTLQDNIEKFIDDGNGEKLLDAPLLNRATQSRQVCGSTIKPVVGISAITQGLNVPHWGVMTVRTGIECTGFLVIDGKKMPSGRCWTASNFLERFGVEGVKHHPMPYPHRGVYGNPDGYLCFADALERSCNVYFETVADAFGIDGLSYWYDKWGLGRETGIGIPEVTGYIPRDLGIPQRSVAWFSGIGQVGVAATPIQMANNAATIARDGIWMRPKLVDGDYALRPFKPRDGREIPDRADLQLSKEALAAARDGMRRVVNSESGTGRDAQMDDLLVAGKTGTAQAEKIFDVQRDGDGKPLHDATGKVVMLPRDPASADHETRTPWYRGWGKDGTTLDHAWFIGFAPADNPQVAFAVLVQYGGSGGPVCGPLVQKILRACMARGYVARRSGGVG